MIFAGTMMAQSAVTVVFVPAIFTPVTIAPGPTSAFAQCTEHTLQNWTGAGMVSCPCFVPGEQAGTVVDAPVGDYPIKILRIGIGWGSQFGGQPQVLEQAIHVYGAGLPNPGAPIYTLPGPQLTDGFINVFDVSALNWTVNSGPFTVTLEFLNQNAGDPFAPSVVHDGNGCQIGKNVVFAIPGGWNDACPLGVTGDWVFYVDYETCPTIACAVNCPQGDADGVIGISNKSPDLDGDGLIALIDVSLFAQVWNTNDYCADFNCDSRVGLVDVAILAQHFNHFGNPGVCN
jgi:hypothetical protein